MPRLFTGLQITDSIAQQLSALQFGLNSARWIDPSDFHITLKFIGDVEPRLADEIAAALDELSVFPFTLELSSLGSFGSNRPRMVWAGVKPSPELNALHKAHEQLAQRLGLKAEGRKFTPHVTLARISGGSAQSVAEYLSHHEDFRSLKFEVTEFKLYSAKASHGGGPYVIEESYPF